MRVENFATAGGADSRKCGTVISVSKPRSGPGPHPIEQSSLGRMDDGSRLLMSRTGTKGSGVDIVKVGSKDGLTVDTLEVLALLALMWIVLGGHC